MPQDSKLFKAILITASFMIIVAGMMAAKSIIVPLMLAVFIAIIVSPLLFWLQAKGLNTPLALIIVLVFIVLLLSSLAMLVGSSISSFTHELPLYEAKLSVQFKDIFVWLEGMGVNVSSENYSNVMNPSRLMQITSTILQAFSSVLTNGMMILFLVLFMLLEASSFPAKLQAVNHSIKGHADQFMINVKQYMVLKTVFSLITGALVTLMLLLVGVDYALLWGLVAFLLNYIPNIGSIIAAVPAVLLTLIQLGSTSALIVALGFVLINVVIGSVVEPKYMGEGLGLSTLVVFISLIFWGWVLGPAGMLLSIPLTVMVKIALETDENTRWIAVLLDSKIPKK